MRASRAPGSASVKQGGPAASATCRQVGHGRDTRQQHQAAVDPAESFQLRWGLSHTWTRKKDKTAGVPRLCGKGGMAMQPQASGGVAT